jgi:hypothetical protein
MWSSIRCTDQHTKVKNHGYGCLKHFRKYPRHSLSYERQDIGHTFHDHNQPIPPHELVSSDR